MSKDEESKKIAKILPNKVMKSLTKDELAAHKKQLEQYYSGENVEEVEQILSSSRVGVGRLNKPFKFNFCLLYTSPSPRDLSTSRMPSSA